MINHNNESKHKRQSFLNEKGMFDIDATLILYGTDHGEHFCIIAAIDIKLKKNSAHFDVDTKRYNYHPDTNFNNSHVNLENFCNTCTFASMNPCYHDSYINFFYCFFPHRQVLLLAGGFRYYEVETYPYPEDCPQYSEYTYNTSRRIDDAIYFDLS